MPTYIEVSPAYGRDYQSAVAAKADWFEARDFYETATGLACNRNDVPLDAAIIIRYGRSLKVTTIEKGDEAKWLKAKAADRATRPVHADFDAWLNAVNIACIAECGMSVYNLPDWDFRAAFDDGIDPRTAALGVINDA